MAFLLELVLLAVVFYLGKLHERYGSIGRAARRLYDKVTNKVEKVVQDFGEGPTDPPSR